MTAGSRIRYHRPHHRDGAGSVFAVWDRRPRGAVFRHPREEAGGWGARPGADAEDAARAAASAVAVPRSGWPRRVLLICRRDDGGDGVPSALPRLAVMSVAAAAASAAAEEDAVAADRRVAAVAGGHRGLARAAVVAAWHRAAEDVRRHRHPRDAHPFSPSAARTPAASAACTCGLVRPDEPASRRNRSKGSVSNLRDRFSCRSCKGCF